MNENFTYEVIIIGGSYSGLAAGMALGRALRKVLIIDAGQPCNARAPHAHNMITMDGTPPGDILVKARRQLLAYPNVETLEGKVIKAWKDKNIFFVETKEGDTFSAKKLLLATGVLDIMPPFKGYKECWGVSMLHCPYCHGYEVAGKKLALIANGAVAWEICRLLYQWSKDLTILTNGVSSIDPEHFRMIRKKGIPVLEKEIAEIEHDNGFLKQVVFKDGSSESFAAAFSKLPFAMHADLDRQLGCEQTELGHIKIDPTQRTTVSGVFAAGDNSMVGRTLAGAIGSGTLAAMTLNKELIEEELW